MDEEKYEIDSCKKCSIGEHEGNFCRCEPRNIYVAKMLRQIGHGPWHKHICETFKASVEAFMTEGMGEHEYKLCEDTIRHTLTYFNEKRKHYREKKGVL